MKRELTIYMRNGATLRFNNVTLLGGQALVFTYESAAQPGTFHTAQFFPKMVAGYSITGVPEAPKDAQ